MEFLSKEFSEDQLNELQLAYKEAVQNQLRLEGALQATKMAIEARDAKEETVTEEPTTEE